MDIFEELHVRRVINAAGTYTVWGGSKMSRKTLDDMREIASSFVSIRELQSRINDAIAQMTHNEGAYICTGAAAGIYLAAAAAIARKKKKKFFYVSEDEIRSSEIIVFKSHRNPYDLALKQLGVRVIEIGFANTILPSVEEDVRQAIHENTAAIYYLASGWAAEGALPLERVRAVTQAFDIPIIVDAAAQLPPVENLWAFTQAGAACTIFSGGKDLKGPQSSGLIVGRKDFLDGIKEVGFPNYGFGRMLKVGREEMVGLYSAVKQYLEMDHEQRYRDCEEQIRCLQACMKDSRLFCVERSYPNEAGQPIARAFARILTDNDRGEELCRFLLEGNPSIYATTEGRNGAYINPMSLNMEEMKIIAERLQEFERLT